MRLFVLTREPRRRDVGRRDEDGMWGRQQGNSEKIITTGALTALSDLLKPADWDRLSAADRTAALSAYPALDVPAVSATGARLDAEMSTRLQRWVGGIVGR